MHPGTSLTDAMREWATPVAGLANYQESPETFAARSEALVVKGSRPLGVNPGQQAQGWATPTTRNDKGPSATKMREGSADLQTQASWPTPQARDSKGTPSVLRTENSRPLNEVATTWPTPRSSDGDKGGPNQAQKGKPSLVALARGHQGLTTPTAGLESSPSGPTSRRLNPVFVEWLMGWPPGWSMPSGFGSTGSGSSETVVSRNR